MNMHRARRSSRVWLLSFVLLLASLWAGSALAQALGYDLSWRTVDSGSGSSSGSAYTLSGTIGQPDAGVLAGGSYNLAGGFWHAGSPLVPASPISVFLPLLQR